jgi:hypothetical protein
MRLAYRTGRGVLSNRVAVADVPLSVRVGKAPVELHRNWPR